MYDEIGKSIGELVERKQSQYGNSLETVGEIINVIFPEGVPGNKCRDLAITIRVLDKIVRILRGTRSGENPWTDIAGYAVLALGQETRDLRKPETNGEKRERAFKEVNQTHHTNYDPIKSAIYETK